MKNKNEFTFNIELTDSIITPKSCSLLITELIKYIIYQKQIIPYPYETLKFFVSKRKDLNKYDNLEIESSSKSILKCLASEKYYKKTTDAVDTIESFLNSISDEILNKNKSLSEVILLLGSTPVNPQDIFRIVIPSLTFGHSDQHHSVRKPLDSLMKNLLTSDTFHKIISSNTKCSSTNVYILFKTSNLFHNDNFIQKENFIIPNRCPHIVDFIFEYPQNLSNSNGFNLICPCIIPFEDSPIFNDKIKQTSCTTEGTSDCKNIKSKINPLMMKQSVNINEKITNNSYIDSSLEEYAEFLNNTSINDLNMSVDKNMSENMTGDRNMSELNTTEDKNLSKYLTGDENTNDLNVSEDINDLRMTGDENISRNENEVNMFENINVTKKIDNLNIITVSNLKKLNMTEIIVPDNTSVQISNSNNDVLNTNKNMTIENNVCNIKKPNEILSDANLNNKLPHETIRNDIPTAINENIDNSSVIINDINTKNNIFRESSNNITNDNSVNKINGNTNLTKKLSEEINTDDFHFVNNEKDINSSIIMNDISIENNINDHSDSIITHNNYSVNKINEEIFIEHIWYQNKLILKSFQDVKIKGNSIVNYWINPNSYV